LLAAKSRDTAIFWGWGMRFHRVLGVAAVALGVPAAAAMAAVETPAAIAVDDARGPACEIHIWPAEKLGSVFYGWFHGGLIDGAQTGRAGYPQIPADPLPLSTQVALLEDVQVDSMVTTARVTRIVHGEPLTSTAIRAGAGRLSDSTASCYAELIVESVKFQQDSFSGGWLNSLIRYRRFGSDAVPVQLFGTYTKTKLTRFPPDSEAEQAAAEAELRAAYVSNIAQFSGALGASASKTSRKK
jgi:hypothetical protein